MTTPAAAPPASTKTDTEDETAAEEQGGGFQRVLNLIERIGNKVPNPAILFLALCVATIVFSQILYLVNAHVTTEVVQPPPHSVQQEYVGGSVLPAEVLPGEQSPASSYHVVHETVRVQGLLTIPGIRYLFTSVISNFMGFTALGIILVIMVGVGVAEIAGLISSLIRKLVERSPPWSLTYIIVFLGIISSIASTVLLTFLLTFVTARLVEPRLGRYNPAVLAPSGDGQPIDADDGADVSREADARGLRWAGFGLLGVVVLILAVTLPSGAPLRDPATGSIIGTSPFMDSLVVMISMAFFVTGVAYGLGAGTIKSSGDVLGAITKAWAGLAGLLLLFLLIAQFIAYFNYSQMPEVAAAWLGDTIENSSVGGLWLLLAAIAITAVVNIIIPQAIAKWALLAPIFIPLFLRLGISPATVLAAYRVADSPGNVVNPIMAYFPLIVVFASRYDKRSGIGTVIALMLPAFVALTVVWTLFFVVWYLLGIPFGLGN